MSGRRRGRQIFLFTFVVSIPALCTQVATPGLRPSVALGLGLRPRYARNKRFIDPAQSSLTFLVLDYRLLPWTWGPYSLLGHAPGFWDRLLTSTRSCICVFFGLRYGIFSLTVVFPQKNCFSFLLILFFSTELLFLCPPENILLFGKITVNRLWKKKQYPGKTQIAFPWKNPLGHERNVNKIVT